MMKKKYVLFFCTFLLLMFAQSSNLHAQKEIKWTSFDKSSSKKMTIVFISVFSNPPKTPNSKSKNTGVPGAWDGWTKRMDSQTFKDKKVIKQGNKNFNFVRLDVYEQKAISFKGKRYNFDPSDTADSQYGRHQLAKHFVGDNRKTPTVAILDKNQEVLQIISAYISEEDLASIMTYYDSGTYKQQPWKEFKKTLKLHLYAD